MSQDKNSAAPPTPEATTSAAIAVRLFSVLRQYVGHRSVLLEVRSPSTAQDVLDALIVAYPVVSPYRTVMRLAVNHTYARDGDPVREGDEVAVITPVSGG